MQMTIQEKMEKALYSDTLFECARNLSEFARAVLEEKNRSTIMKTFYGSLFQYAMMDYVTDDLFEESKDSYYICDGKSASAKYLALMMPAKERPIQSLQNIQKFAQETLETLMPPIGERIEEEMAEDILSYLDEEYNFGKKVFRDRKAIFALLDVSHKLHNSECLMETTDGEMVLHFFLYCMNNKDDSSITPEAVLFHELGHAIHVRYTRDIRQVPEEVLKILRETCMPGIDTLLPEQQSEVFADILSAGMMFESPFESYSPFSYMLPKDKKVFKEIVKTILARL